MKPPLLVVAAIITDGNKVLLVKRVREPFQGCWGFIGGIGGFEHSSDPEEVVKMEVEGDIGCDFQPTFFTYNYEEGKTPSVVLYFHGCVRGLPTPNFTYVSEYKWVPIEEAMKLRLAFSHNDILTKFWQHIRK